MSDSDRSDRQNSARQQAARFLDLWEANVTKLATGTQPKPPAPEQERKP